MKHYFLLALMICVCVLITGCIAPTTRIEGTPSLASNDLTPTSNPAILENPQAIGPDNIPAGINPLTGQLAADPESLNRRPIVVKISNAPAIVRPQAGLNQADLVFEHYVEGGLTRFSAIFYGQAPDRVGSIRSARLIDLELTPMYGGLLSYSGASIGVEDRLNTSDFVHRLYKGVLYGLPYYWRDESIDVPHNLFMNPNALWMLAAQEGKNQRPNLQSLAFLAEAPNSVYPATNIDIRYHATRVQWQYDSQLGSYRRFSDGQAHLDANAGQQVTAANVVIIFAEHHDTDIVESQWQGVISYSTEITLQPEGDAILFRDGKRYDGRWLRPARQTPISLRTTEGQVLYMKPGNTWFQVVRLPQQMSRDTEWVRVDA
jgi:hypothetical protein